MFEDKAELLIKGDATIIKFKEEAGKYYIVHLAAHGVIKSPADMSYILLAPGGYKGKLKIREIQDMIIDYEEGFKQTQLVVLSACSMAISETPGVDISTAPLSVSRAFDQLGINAIIASLWNVSDKATKELMINFYKKMINSRYEIGDSLLESQREMLRESEEFSHPYFWNAFILIGDWR